MEATLRGQSASIRSPPALEVGKNAARLPLTRDLLTEEGEVAKADVIKAGRACGFAERTIQNARKRIGAETKIHGFGKEKVSVWLLPIRANYSTMHANPKKHGTNGTNEETAPFVPIVPFISVGTESGTDGGMNEEVGADEWL